STLALNDGAHALVVGSISGVNGIARSEEHTAELQSRRDVVCRLLLEKKRQLGEGARTARGRRARGRSRYRQCAGARRGRVRPQGSHRFLLLYLDFFFLEIRGPRTFPFFPPPPLSR